MFQGNPLLEKLHQATRLAHWRLERRVDICCPNFDVHIYRRLLQDFWGFYQPLERKLVVLADHILPSPYSPQRHKAPRLNQDLLSLGMTEAEIAALPLCGRLPTIPSLPRVFGVLYAIEGVTVGERNANTHLLEQLRIDPSRGGSFFSSLSASYDPFLNSYWQEFIAVSESVEEPDPQTLAIEAAVDAFDCLEAWLDYRHRPKPANFSHWKPHQSRIRSGCHSSQTASVQPESDGIKRLVRHKDFDLSDCAHEQVRFYHVIQPFPYYLIVRPGGRRYLLLPWSVHELMMPGILYRIPRKYNRTSTLIGTRNSQRMK